MKFLRQIPIKLLSGLIMALLVWNSAVVVLAQVEEVVAEESVNVESEEALATSSPASRRSKERRRVRDWDQPPLSPPTSKSARTQRATGHRFLLGQHRRNGCGAHLRL